MPILKTIKSRRSIREFKDKPVEQSKIIKILEAGRWAPSGLNNQPWKFVVVRDKEVRSKLAECTESDDVVLGAPVNIAVFLDKGREYNRIKDIQAIGACIQNMLLEVHDLKLGACWLGEILNQRTKVEKLLGVSKKLELMAVIAVGYPKAKKRRGSRRSLRSQIIKNYSIKN